MTNQRSQRWSVHHNLTKIIETFGLTGKEDNPFFCKREGYPVQIKQRKLINISGKNHLDKQYMRISSDLFFLKYCIYKHLSILSLLCNICLIIVCNFFFISKPTLAEETRVTIDGPHIGMISALMFSPDGNLIISGGEDSTLKLWHVKSGKLIRTFMGHTRLVNTIAISPDSKLAASGSNVTDKFGSKSMSLILWDIQSGEAIRQARPDDSSSEPHIIDVRFSANGKQLYSATWGRGNIHIWDIPESKGLSSLDSDYKPSQLIETNVTIKVNGIKTRTNSRLTALTVTPNGEGIFVLGDDGLSVIWKQPFIGFFGNTSIFFNLNRKLYDSLEISDNLEHLLVQDTNEVLLLSRIHGTVKRFPLKPMKQEGRLHPIFSSDGKSILTIKGCKNRNENCLALIDINSGQVREVYSPGIKPPYAFSPDKKFIISAGGSIIDVENGNIIRKLW